MSVVVVAASDLCDRESLLVPVPDADERPEAIPSASLEET